MTVLNSRPETVLEIGSAPEVCRDVVLPRLRALRDDPNFRNAVAGHLANDAPGRDAVVLARIDAILGATATYAGKSGFGRLASKL